MKIKVNANVDLNVKDDKYFKCLYKHLKMLNLRDKYEYFKEMFCITRLISPLILTSGIRIPSGDLHQIGPDAFVRCIANPKNPIGNIFIVQGGARHLDAYAYYVKVTSYYVRKNMRVFVYLKLNPVVNFEYAHGFLHN